MSNRTWMTVPALAAGLMLLAVPNALAADRAVIYDVVQEGLTPEQMKRIDASFGVEREMKESGEKGGTYDYVGADFAAIPQKTVAQGKDEAGRPTVSQALDVDALRRLRALPADAALKRAAALPDLVGVGGDLRAAPSVGNTELETSDNDGRRTGKYALDTSISYAFALNGLPVSGPGAKLRIAFAGDGSVTQLNSALRQVKAGETVPVISPEEAAKGCAALYPDDVRQGTPTLGYHFPELGTAQRILPVYTCSPLGGDGTQANLLLPAVRDSAPTGGIQALLLDGSVRATATEIKGGTAPYRLKWSSSSTVLERTEGTEIAYKRAPRDGKLAGERLTLEITDANGLTGRATVTFAGDGEAKAESVPGGGGYGELAIGPTDVGVEQTVDEWQCANDSGTGFRQVMNAHGINSAFNFFGTNAWERDFKKGSLGGTDSTYVDNVDAVFYTGHGGPNGFSFKDTTHDDGGIGPSDADWGNGDLEWLNLESCQVLRDTNGNMDQLTRWGGTVNGLHMINGYHTNARCVDGGTGRLFAQLLLGDWFLPAMPVRNAWAVMAITKQPSGRRYRSIGNIGAGGVTNVGDYFWGEGPTGPDITKAARTGMWSLSGTT
jgi:hypothetical protein